MHAHATNHDRRRTWVLLFGGLLAAGALLTAMTPPAPMTPGIGGTPTSRSARALPTDSVAAGTRATSNAPVTLDAQTASATPIVTVPATSPESAPSARLVPAPAGSRAAGPMTLAQAQAGHLAPARTPNWAGYVATGGVFTAVTGTWQVPTLTCGTTTSYSAQWVGIDGYGNGSVEQAGVNAFCHDGAAHYNAWWEMYGDQAENGGASVALPAADAVRPGDTVTAAVRVAGNRWTLTMRDTSAGWSFTKTVADFAAAQASAEWIVERPSICASASNLSSCTATSLAPSDPITLTSATATREAGGHGSARKSAATAPAESFHPISIEMADPKTGSVLAVPSSLTGGSFTVSPLVGRSGKAPIVDEDGRCTTRPFTDVAITGPFCGPIAWLKASGITTGFKNGAFHPAAPISRAAMAAFLYRRADDGQGATIRCTVRPFSDVPTTSPFCGPITWLKENGIATGFANGTFQPAAPISRAAMAAFLYRSQTSETHAPACTAEPFADVPTASPFCGSIAWLRQQHVTDGYADGSYRPAKAISRAAMAAFLYRVATTQE